MGANPEQSNPASTDPFVRYYAAQSVNPATLAHHARLKTMLVRALGSPRPRESLHVLDIGCGAGSFSRLWAADGFRVAGLDINQELVDLARSRLKDAGLTADFKVGSACSLPWPDRNFSVVAMPELLEHIPDWELCIAEAVRVLAPGGVLYLSTTNVLCPRQQEFDLPLYSWYPAALKRHCVRLATTTRPHWVNYAKFPAVNWFSPLSLGEYLRAHHLEVLDRFDVWARYSTGRSRRAIGRTFSAVFPLRLLGYVAMPATFLVARKLAG